MTESLFSKAADLIRQGNILRDAWGLVVDGVPCYCVGGALAAADDPRMRTVVAKWGSPTLAKTPVPSDYASRGMGAVLAILNRDRNYDPNNRESERDVAERQRREFKRLGRRKPRWHNVPEWNDHRSLKGRTVRKVEVLEILDKAHRLYGHAFPLLNEKPPVRYALAV